MTMTKTTRSLDIMVEHGQCFAADEANIRCSTISVSSLARYVPYPCSLFHTLHAHWQAGAASRSRTLRTILLCTSETYCLPNSDYLQGRNQETGRWSQLDCQRTSAIWVSAVPITLRTRVLTAWIVPDVPYAYIAPNRASW